MIIFRSKQLDMPPRNQLPQVNAKITDEKNAPVRFIPLDYKEPVLDAPFTATNALYICSSGAIEVVTYEGTTIILPNQLSGTYIIGRFTRINSAGTTIASPEDNIRLVY